MLDPNYISFYQVMKITLTKFGEAIFCGPKSEVQKHLRNSLEKVKAVFLISGKT